MCSHVRVHLIPARIKQWKGPTIFVIYIASNKQASSVTEFLMAKSFPSNVQIYTYEGKEGCFEGKHFPINRLRNIAIQYVQTTHYVVLDMDLVISDNPQRALQNTPSMIWRDYHSVAIIPTFFLTNKAVNKNECNTFKNCTTIGEEFAPRTFNDLTICVDSQHCSRDNDNLHAHGYVSEKWLLGQSNPEQLQCLPYEGLEPYVVLRHHLRMPMYDPIFYDYGGNKQIFIEELRFFSSEWFVLSNIFGINLEHPEYKRALTITTRSPIRLRYNEEYSKGICLNPFLVFLRTYELRSDNHPLINFCE